MGQRVLRLRLRVGVQVGKLASLVEWIGGKRERGRGGRKEDLGQTEDLFRSVDSWISPRITSVLTASGSQSSKG